MLITNFSAGELSKNLYGRTDIPQYYSGASKLENFDVIPTGGIKRRGGTKLVEQLTEGEGRIIPFIVNRDSSFLLYLTPEKTSEETEKILVPAKITVFRLEKDKEIEKKEFNSNENLKLYKSINEINDVQYAQNFDTMVLVHENYPPLEVKLENNTLNIKTFAVSYEVSVSENGGIINTVLGDNDDVYYKDKLLKSEGNYPRAAVFYNGRLIFAGTRNNPQRIFASTSGGIHNFSTYKKFLTEEREYITVHANIIGGGKLELKSPDIPIKFVKPINEYYVDSIHFPKGARISNLIGQTIEIKLNEESGGVDSKETAPPVLEIEPGYEGPLFIRSRIEGEIKAKLDCYNTAEKKQNVESVSSVKGWYENREKVGNLTIRFETKNAGFNNDTTVHRYEYEYYICYGVNNIQTVMRQRYGKSGGWESWIYYIDEFKIGGDNQIVKKYKDDEGGLKQLIKNFINLRVRVLHDEYEDGYKEWSDDLVNTNGLFDTYDNGSFPFPLPQPTLDKIADYMHGKIFETMEYHFHSDSEIKEGVYSYENMHYDIPGNYYYDILPFLKATENVYVSFYTKKIIEDRYPTPDCGFTFEIASDMNDAIQWLAVNKGLIVGTETGEWIIPPGVHATNVQATLNSRYGSDKIQGTAIGDATCFFQTGKKSLVEYYIPQQDNNFRANNMAMLSDDMLRESPAVDFDYTTSPYTKLIITREDGQAVTLLYERGTGTFAWSRLITNGKIKSAAVIPGSDGYDEIYMLVERNDLHYLEVLKETADVYLDGYKPWTGDRTGYSDAAVVFFEEEQRVDLAKTKDLPKAAGKAWIGYKYTSRVVSMPILANNSMKPNNVKNIFIRFLDSFMPKLKALPNGSEDEFNVVEPYTGVKKTMFPGSWDTDVRFELYYSGPKQCKILAINTEVN